MHDDDEVTMSVDKWGSKVWKNKAGYLHRLDGPAIESAIGHKEWWVNGKRYRLDGPAIEYPDGKKRWLVDGKLHRLDGPAVDKANGDKEWWINGIQKTKHDFFEALTDDEKLVILMSPEFFDA